MRRANAYNVIEAKMIINLILWILVGTFAGFLVFLIFPTRREFLIGIIMAGIAGAFFGGTFYSLIRIGALSVAIDPIATFMATFGAIMILRLIRRIVPIEESSN